MADENKDLQQQSGDGAKPETVTMTKEDYESKLTGKYAEGAKNEAKRLAKELGITIEEAKAALNELKEAKDARSKSDAELTTLKAERVAMKFGASAEDAEDAIALLRGKGMELTEENIKAVVEKRFKGQNGVTPNGVLPGNQKPGDKPKLKGVI